MSYSPNPNNVVILSKPGFVDFNAAGGMLQPSPFIPKYKVLAEGDSWFYRGGLELGKRRNLIDGFNFNDQPTILCNMAFLGDTIKTMADIKSSREFLTTLKDDKWDALMLSGGGNDLIKALEGNYSYLGKTVSILKANAGASSFIDHISQPDLDLLCQAISESFKTIFDYKMATPNAATPVFVHVYDYPTPRNAPATILVFKHQPSLYTALVKLNVKPGFWQLISDYIFDAVADTILTFDGNQNVNVIDTRNTLDKALPGTTGESGDWLNETHPNSDGMQKLADKINLKMLSVL